MVVKVGWGSNWVPTPGFKEYNVDSDFWWKNLILLAHNAIRNEISTCVQLTDRIRELGSKALNSEVNFLFEYIDLVMGYVEDHSEMCQRLLLPWIFGNLNDWGYSARMTAKHEEMLSKSQDVLTWKLDAERSRSLEIFNGVLQSLLVLSQRLGELLLLDERLILPLITRKLSENDHCELQKLIFNDFNRSDRPKEYIAMTFQWVPQGQQQECRRRNLTSRNAIKYRLHLRRWFHDRYQKRLKNLLEGPSRPRSVETKQPEPASSRFPPKAPGNIAPRRFSSIDLTREESDGPLIRTFHF